LYRYAWLGFTLVFVLNDLAVTAITRSSDTEAHPHRWTSMTKRSTLRSLYPDSNRLSHTSRWRPSNRSKRLKPLPSQPTYQQPTQQLSARMRAATSGSPLTTVRTSTEPLEVQTSGSSLRVEFMLNQCQHEFRPLRFNQRGDCIQNGATNAPLCDSLQLIRNCLLLE